LRADVIPGIEVIDAHVPVTLLNLTWHRLEWPPVEMFAGDVDVTHSMHPLLMPARYSAQVVTVHDLYFLESPENTSAEIKRDYPALAERHARRADAVITVSKYTAGKVQSKLGVPDDRITICPLGAPAWAPLDRHCIDGPILFMGTIEPRKNVGVLLDATLRCWPVAQMRLIFCSRAMSRLRAATCSTPSLARRWPAARATWDTSAVTIANASIVRRR
jgi:hypothetical protein